MVFEKAKCEQVSCCFLTHTADINIGAYEGQSRVNDPLRDVARLLRDDESGVLAAEYGLDYIGESGLCLKSKNVGQVVVQIGLGG